MTIKTKSHSTYTFLILVVMLNLFSCREETVLLNEKTTVFSKFSKSEDLIFRKIYDYKKGAINRMHIKDSVLVLHNRSRGAKYLFYNYSLHTGELSKGYISKGRGPGEILSSFSSGFTNNYFYVHDLALKKIIRAKSEAILLPNKDSLIFDEFRFKTHTGIRIAFTDNSNYYAVENLSSEFKIAEMDMVLDTTIAEFGEFKQIPDDLPIEVLKQAYSPHIFLKPSGDKLVLAYRHTDVIEIYNTKTKTNIAIQGPDNYEPSYVIGSNNRGFFSKSTDETKIAFVSGKATDKYIYLGYSGIPKKAGKEKWGFCKYIYVYDWEGNPIKKMTLNNEGIMSFAISEEQKKIFAFDMFSGAILEANINL